MLKAKKTLIYSLVSLCGLFLARSASAFPFGCTAVTYAFRHAEDVPTEELKPGEHPHLTPVGLQHAKLYVSMISDFAQLHNYCPVGYVYAMYDTKPDGAGGTLNPYQTAQPLAIDACNERATFFGLLGRSVDCSTGTAGTLPLMTVQDEPEAKLYEYMGTKKSEKGTGIPPNPPKQGPAVTDSLLRSQLYFNSYPAGNFPGQLSNAIFWTSQGLHALGEAIATGSNLPTKPPQPGKAIPPRNAVYVFEWIGASQQMGFAPPKNITQYVQCFNVSPSQPTPGGSTYYCSTKGNLPADIKESALPALQGKICDTTNLAADCKKIN
jgi:hypothetical protein